MGLFKPDLYRSFAVGFLLGAAVIALQAGPELFEQIIPQAMASTLR